MYNLPRNIHEPSRVFNIFTLKDILVLLAFLTICVICIACKSIGVAILFGLLGVLSLVKSKEGNIYEVTFSSIKYLFEKKVISREDVLGIKEIDKDGLIKYINGYFGRFVEVESKDFGLLENSEQKKDIHGFAKCLLDIDPGVNIGLLKLQRPVDVKEYLIDNLKIDTSKDRVKNSVIYSRCKEVIRLANASNSLVNRVYIVLTSKNRDEVELNTGKVMQNLLSIELNSKVLERKQVCQCLKCMFYLNINEETPIGQDYLKYILEDDIKFDSKYCYVGDVKFSKLTVTEYPLQVKNAWLVDILNIPCTNVFVSMKMVDTLKATRDIDRCINEMDTRRIQSFKASDLLESSTHKLNMEDLLEKVKNGNEGILDVCISLTVFEKDGVDRKFVKHKLKSLGFDTSLMYMKQIEGISLGMPNTDAKGKYYRSINSESVGAMFPFVYRTHVEKGGNFLGFSKGNFYMPNLWKRNSIYQNSNCFCIGSSGSGKSFFLKTLLLHEWANGTKIIILDPENEYSRLVRNLGGKNIDVGSGKDGCINPFHIYKGINDLDSVSTDLENYNSHLKTLEAFFRTILGEIDVYCMECINSAVIEAYKDCNVLLENGAVNLSVKRFPDFTDVVNCLEKLGWRAKNKEPYELAKIQLEKFTSGRYKDIWNGQSTLKSNGDITCFNFQHLIASGNNVVSNAQMLLIFKYIEQELIKERERNPFNPRRTICIVDEAHVYIDPKYPISLDFFYSLSKRIRKYGGSLITATQSISDWTSTPSVSNKTSAIIKNCQYSYIFKLSTLDLNDLQEIYKQNNGFNVEEQRRILNAKIGEAIYVSSPKERTQVQIHLNKELSKLFNN